MHASFQMVALLGLAFPLQSLHGQSLSMTDDGAFAERMTPAELKLVYLACDRASSTMLLTSHEAKKCSFVHEELKNRVFGGDFELMLAWWKEERDAAKDRKAPRSKSY